VVDVFVAGQVQLEVLVRYGHGPVGADGEHDRTLGGLTAGHGFQVEADRNNLGGRALDAAVH
jgi:hypothetical protein